MKILIEIICFSRLVWTVGCFGKKKNRYIVILADKLFAPVQEHFDQSVDHSVILFGDQYGTGTFLKSQSVWDRFSDPQNNLAVFKRSARQIKETAVNSH